MSECIETDWPDSGNGYGRRGRQSAHRTAWTQEHGDIPSGMYVLHSCDNRKCVNIAHLRLGTHADNMRDMKQRQRNKVPHPNMQGSKHHKAKLDEYAVRNIRSLYSSGYGTNELARMFAVTPGNIGFIITRKTWRHV